jgi:hypothetical protein
VEDDDRMALSVNDADIVCEEQPAVVKLVGGKYIGKDCTIKKRLALKVRIELVETGMVVDIMPTSLNGTPRAATIIQLRRSERIKGKSRAVSLRRSARLNKGLEQLTADRSAYKVR